MRITQPNGSKIKLDTTLPYEGKVEFVREKLREFNQEITDNWESKSVRIFLDALSNYLVWHKEEEQTNKEDKEVLSRHKLKKMSRGDQTISNFTTLNDLDKSSLGIKDNEGVD